MIKNPRILDLLETLMDSGTTPEEACADCPELLPELREQWELCRKIDARIDALFGGTGPANAGQTAAQPAVDLPRIPGYRMVAVQGRGGIGIVYRARHLALNRTVALKMLLSGAFAGRVERGRFLREARAVAGLRHNNIVQVFDVGEFDRRPYFTMELVEGATLANFLGGQPQPSANAAAMLITLANAIAYAHDSGIVHRDLKPANVLLASDGTLKISDFGLARQLEGNDSLTITGARVGTPSYMAPEQALGKSALGPAADIYSLGAILYEMLSGRPPFRGESAAETERQLLSDEVVRPSKLNTRVPRDLETICLKCLEKDPRRRYPSTKALADDLRRFQNGEPVTARRTAAAERAVKWVRRHPAVTTGAAAVLLITAMLITGITWLACQHAAAVKIAELELQDAISFQKQCAWDQASAALDRAEFKLDGRGPVELRRQLDQARRDSASAASLEAIRLDRSGTSRGLMNFPQARDHYATMLKDLGFGTPADDPAIVGERIKASNIRAELVAALYDWMLIPGVAERDWLWEVSRTADNDTSAWRAAIHSHEIWNHGAALLKTSASAPVASQPVPVLMAVAYQLQSMHQPSIPFLLKLQGAYPEDFWVNLTLADQLREADRFDESILYYQTASALRPMSTVVHNNLGMTLFHLGRYPEADSEFRRACDIDPLCFPPVLGVAASLRAAGNFKGSIEWANRYLAHSPNDPNGLHLLGRDLAATGQPDGAISAYRQSLEADPTNRETLKDLVAKLLPGGREDEALAAWKNLIDHDPSNHDAWNGYGELCLFLGRQTEYGRVRDETLRRFGDSTNPNICERVGRCALLLPSSVEQTQQAAAVIDRAVAADRDHPNGYGRYFRLAKALADYRGGDFAGAVSLLHGDASTVLGPTPGLILAMSEYQLGRHESAASTLTAAVAGFDWDHPGEDLNDFWMYTILRREAEAMIAPQHPALH